MKKTWQLAVIIILVSLMMTGCGTKSAKAMHKKGLQCMEERKYDMAVSYLKQAVEKNQDQAEYFIDYGIALSKTGKTEEALVQFQKAVLDKNNKIVRENNKRAYRGMGIAYFEAADYEKAVSSFESALKLKELSKLNSDIRCYLADAQMGLGQYSKAVQTYQKILEENKKDADVYAKKADAEVKLKDYENAQKDYNKAIQLEKDNYNYYFGKYFMLLEQNDKTAAEDILNQAETIKVKSEKDKFNVGKINFFRGHYEEAEKAMNEAVKKEIKEGYYYLGEIERCQGAFDEAVSQYKKYIKEAGDFAIAAVYNQLGVCLIQTGDYDGALKMIEKGLKSNNAAVIQKLRLNEIITLEKKGKFSDAWEKVQIYREYYPDDKSMKKEFEFLKTRVNSDK